MAILDIAVAPPAGGVVRVALAGEVDLSVRGALFGALAGAVETEDVDLIEVDLARVWILDAAGIGALLAVRNECMAQGKALQVRGAEGLTREVLEITGVYEVLGGKTDA